MKKYYTSYERYKLKEAIELLRVNGFVTELQASTVSDKIRNGSLPIVETTIPQT